MNLKIYRSIGRAFAAGFLVAAFLLALGNANGAFASGPDSPVSVPEGHMPQPIPGAYVAGRPFNAWPACKYEDSNNCRWDARLRGNGVGASFVAVGQKRHYVKLSSSPARGTLAYYPPCKSVGFDGSICWYSANTRGSGLGLDYYYTSGGVKRFLPYQMIET